MWREAEKFLLKDKYLASLVKKHGHCQIKPSKKKDYFFDLVYAIIGQQLSGAAAATIFGRVRLGLNQEISPVRILKTSDEKFKEWGVSKQKIRYLRDLSEKVKKGKVKISKLDTFSDEEVVNELVAVKGIGQWTAEMFLMFSLARPDIFPVDDLGINNGVEKLLKNKLIRQELAKFAERWRPYRTIASWYIWKIVDSK